MSKALSVHASYAVDAFGVTIVKISADITGFSYSLNRQYDKDMLEHLHEYLYASEVTGMVDELKKSVELTSAQMRFLEGSILCALSAHIDLGSNSG